MRKILLYILILIALTGTFDLKQEANAQTSDPTKEEYKLLAPLPCQPKTEGCSPDGKLESFNPTKDDNLGSYLNLMIEIFIGLCAVLSVVMIVVGGIEYMTSELAHTKEAGKERITQAILGLLIALGAYVLLFTINPDLLVTKIKIEKTPATKPDSTSAVTAVKPENKVCSIQSATFFPSGNQPEGWFKDNKPPSVKMNVVGKDCAGKIAEISIVEDDTVGIDDDISQLDDWNVTFPASNHFILDLVAGETECEQWFGNDCEYFIKIDLDGPNFSTEDQNSIGNLEYDCDGLCDENWILKEITPVDSLQ